MKVKPETRRGH